MLEAIVRQLLAETGASRVTLRQDVPGDYAFPVTHEAVAPGVGSLKEERTVDLRTQPVVRELEGGRQVVQNDSVAANDDPAFQQMLRTYGGLSAQIVTPVMHDERLVAIVSVHELRRPRVWTAVEIRAATLAAEEVEAQL
jgi:GAF domain-containing protein